MPRKKEISEIVLELSDKQLLYLRSEGSATAEGLGVSPAEFKAWDKNRLFSLVEQVVCDCTLSCWMEAQKIDDAVLNEFRAAILVAEGFAYEAIEKHLGFEEGAILGYLSPAFESALGDLFGEATGIIEKRKREAEQAKQRKAEEKVEQTDWDKKELMIPLILAGKNNQEIADEIGVSRQTVWRWRNSDSKYNSKSECEDYDDDEADDASFDDRLQAEIADFRAAQRARYANLLDKAYAKLEILLDSEDSAIQLRPASAILKFNSG